MSAARSALADRLLPDRVRLDGEGGRAADPGPDAALPDPGWLRSGRVHEITGDGGRAFAAGLAGRLEGPVVWLQESRAPDRLCPHGLRMFFDPARLILTTPVGALALMQVFEEALRSGAAPLVVAELDASPDLTQGRRLQLAAGTGGGRGLALVPAGRTRAGTAETRWHCSALLGDEGTATAQRWELTKDKRGRPGAWTVGLRRGGFRLAVEDGAVRRPLIKP